MDHYKSNQGYCANCMTSLLEGQILTTGLNQWNNNESLTIAEALESMFCINWKYFSNYKAIEIQSATFCTRGGNSEDGLKIELCNDCTLILSDLWKLYSDFEKLTHSESLIKKAKHYQCACSLHESTDETIAVPVSEDLECKLFENFQCLEQQTTEDQSEIEIKHNETMCLQEKENFQLADSIENDLKLVIKLERISGEELRYSDQNKLNKTSKNKPGRKKLKIRKLKTLKVVKHFNCTFCPKKFSAERNFQTHINIHIRKRRQISCEICGKVVNSYYLKDHMKLHNQERILPFECKICGKKFKVKKGYQKHMFNFHSTAEEKLNSKLRCNICSGLYATPNSLKVHILTHSKTTEKFNCNQCDKEFSSKENLNLHLKAHESKSIYTCKICNKEFPIEEYLEQHERLHNDANRPHICTICQKGFHRSSGLKKHLETHASKKSFVCEHCGKSFKTPRSLDLHLILHRDEQLPIEKFKCKHCAKCLKNSHTLYQHILNTHRTDVIRAKQSFQCSHCGKKLYDHKNLRLHVEKMHEKVTDKANECETRQLLTTKS